MGRQYAGVLGLTAFSTVLIRGAIANLSTDSTLLTAILFLFAFAALGALLGTIAEHTVVEAVRQRFQTEMKLAENEVNKIKN
jgi:apolipoprotein N-acyltransferase